ncbi:MAG: hypothetical protein JWP63_504 [Candidatus Solibacter sp.]|nr:hypothetical protein [Candidatus Solibacter sp.]
MADLQLLRPVAAAHNPPDSFDDSFADSLDEERREVLESVMSVLASATPDADQMAACDRLLRHLAGAAPGRLP